MRAEPAMIGAAIAAVLSVITLLVFGHELTKEEEAAIVAVVTLIMGLFVRAKVSPVG